MSIIAVVPARGGSKGIPRKNLKLLDNKPLIFHIIETLLKNKKISLVVLSSEDEEIKKVATKKFKNKILIQERPKYLSKDHTPLTSVVKYAAEKLHKEGINFKYVLQVAPTCPFIKQITVNQIIQALENNYSDCVVTLKRVEHEHPYRVKELDKNNYFRQFIKNVNVEKFISRQDLPTLYCTSGAIYARTFKLLKTFNEKNFCLGKKPLGVVVDDYEAINIDRPIDFDFAKLIIKLKKKKL